MRRHAYWLTAAALVGAVIAARCLPPEPPPQPPAEPADPPSVDVLILRGRVKTWVAEEVVAGRWSLVEAAALFGEVNRLTGTSALTPAEGNPWALTAPARTEEERLCRQVVQWVDGLWLTRPPEDVAAAVARLNDEFLAEQQRPGGVRLPDPSTLTPVGELLEQFRGEILGRPR